MRVDVSEIKTYKTCKRQWLLSSRNRFHLRPVVTPKAFALGTLFHESLHSLYLGVPEEKVMDIVKREMSSEDICLLAMIPGYAEEVLPKDLEKYQVLDIEHKFAFHPCTSDGEIIDEDLEVCGSIDMICLDRETNEIWGFEHKTAKNFRDTTFLWMDEQPRVYTLALRQYVAQYNEKHPDNPAKLGGIFINEVKKLLRKFSYQRTACVYSEDDLDNFATAFFGMCCACKHSVDINDVAAPSPSYWTCQMCDFKNICETYMYSTLDKDTVLKAFGNDFVERDVDHLDEKAEREGGH